MAAITVYLCTWKSGVHRRNRQSWDSLLARLRLDWSARELTDQPLWNDELNATPVDAWRRMEGPRGLCVMLQNARVMLEMSDYAARNSDSIDRQLLETLRSDAHQIHVCVLTALGQYAFSQLNESICVNAFRAASTYLGMAARMTRLLQEHAGVIVPDFVAAM